MTLTLTKAEFSPTDGYPGRVAWVPAGEPAPEPTRGEERLDVYEVHLDVPSGTEVYLTDGCGWAARVPGLGEVWLPDLERCFAAR